MNGDAGCYRRVLAVPGGRHGWRLRVLPREEQEREVPSADRRLGGRESRHVLRDVLRVLRDTDQMYCLGFFMLVHLVLSMLVGLVPCVNSYPCMRIGAPHHVVAPADSWASSACRSSSLGYSSTGPDI